MTSDPATSSRPSASRPRTDAIPASRVDESAGAPGPAFSLAQRRLHPAYLLITIGRSIRSLIPLIAVGIWRAPGWAVAAVAVLVLLHSVALWWLRTYSVVDGSLRVRGGLVKRTDDTISVGRISALDAERGVLQRLLGVWGVRVRTPGNVHRSAIHLASLSTAALEELRTAVRQPLPPIGRQNLPDTVELPRSRSLRYRGVSGPASQTPPTPDRPPVTLAVLSGRTMLLAAVTGTSMPLILAGAAATWGRAHDVLPDRVFDRITRDVFVGGSTTVLLLLGAIVAAVLAGIALTSLRLARFTLIRDGDRLRISRGLIAQRAGSIPVDRVQAVRLVEGFWRQMLGYCAIEVEVAGLSKSSDTERMLFPLLRTASAPDLMARALPEFGWCPTTFHPVPTRARRRYLTVPLLVAALLTGGALLLPGWGEYLAIAPIPLAVMLGRRSAADAGWAVDATTVTLRWRRVLARHTVIARRHRVQLTEVGTTVLQRRAGLAGVRLLLSSRRSARIRHVEAADALLLLHVVGRPLADDPDASPE